MSWHWGDNEMDNMFDEMERLVRLGPSHKAYMNISSRYWMPPADICETNEAVIIRVDLADVEKKDISVTFRNGLLDISGVRHQHHPENMIALHQMEIDTGRFLRRIRIDAVVSEQDIDAEYTGGILVITVPKEL